MSRTKPKPKIKTIPWDSAALLKSDKDIALYLEAVFEDGDPNLVTAAFRRCCPRQGHVTNRASCGSWSREPLQGALDRG